MFKNSTLILLVFCQYSFSSAPSAGHSGAYMCPTDYKHPSSNFIRQLAFHYLAKKGHANPHQITMVNAMYNDQHHACAHFVEERINFNETHFAQESIGVKRLILGHEVVHITEKHLVEKDPQASRQQERWADIEGVRLGNCELCTKEWAQYFVRGERKSYNKKWNLPEALSEFGRLSLEQRQRYAAMAKMLSEEIRGSHPCGLERGYYLYNLSQSEIKGHVCADHAYAQHQQEPTTKIIDSERQRSIVLQQQLKLTQPQSAWCASLRRYPTK